MANIAVKNVGSLFVNPAVPVAAKGAVGNGDFQKVWSSQRNKGTSESVAPEGDMQKTDRVNEWDRAGYQEKTAVRQGEETKETQLVNEGEGEVSASSDTQGQEETVSGRNDVSETEKGSEQIPGMEEAETDAAAAGIVLETEVAVGEVQKDQNVQEGLNVKEQEKTVSVISKVDITERKPDMTREQLWAMEVLGTAAANLMEQISDVFGITVEEVWSAMDSLEMGRADLLDPSKLRGLLLELGGAQNAYALLTDGVLYDNYHKIMNQLDQILQEGAGELKAEPEQLQMILSDSMQEAKAPVVIIPEFRLEKLREGAEPVREENFSLDSGTPAETVQEGQKVLRQDTGAQEQGERQPESRQGKDNQNQPNVYVQDFRTTQFQPELQQVQELSQDSPWSTDTRQIMDQILDYMKLNVNADTTSLEMQLHPASLGTLHVQIASRGGVVTANFITENEAVKVTLENQMLQLREQFEEQGVKVEAIEVTVQTHEFEQNLEQGRGRSQQETEKRSRGRRFHVGGITAENGMGADDTVEDERMIAGGSTVSYTA